VKVGRRKGEKENQKGLKIQDINFKLIDDLELKFNYRK